MSREIPFYIPPIGKEEKQYIEEVLSLEGESKVDALEKNFQEYIGAKYALAVSSGTSALHLAMCALDLKRGDKVVCSVNSFPDLPEVVRHFDAEPIFVDCEAVRICTSGASPSFSSSSILIFLAYLSRL